MHLAPDNVLPGGQRIERGEGDGNVLSCGVGAGDGAAAPFVVAVSIQPDIIGSAESLHAVGGGAVQRDGGDFPEGAGGVGLVVVIVALLRDFTPDHERAAAAGERCAEVLQRDGDGLRACLLLLVGAGGEGEFGAVGFPVRLAARRPDAERNHGLDFVAVGQYPDDLVQVAVEGVDVLAPFLPLAPQPVIVAGDGGVGIEVVFEVFKCGIPDDQRGIARRLVAGFVVDLFQGGVERLDAGIRQINIDGVRINVFAAQQQVASGKLRQPAKQRAAPLVAFGWEHGETSSSEQPEAGCGQDEVGQIVAGAVFFRAFGVAKGDGFIDRVDAAHDGLHAQRGQRFVFVAGRGVVFPADARVRGGVAAAGAAGRVRGALVENRERDGAGTERLARARRAQFAGNGTRH